MTPPLAVRSMLGLAKVLAKVGLAPDTHDVTKLSPEKRIAGPGKVFLRKPPANVTTEDRVVENVPVRIYRTPTPSGKAVLYIHGGGFVVGGLAACDHIVRDLAHRTNHLFVSVDYRLAPEHPFPAGLDDCDAALQWMTENADTLGVDPSDIAVAGDSAGGNLSAALCLRHLDDASVTISRQVLIYPMLDLTCSRDSWVTEVIGDLDRTRATDVVAGYLVDTAVTDPLISPLFATSLTGLPPALVITSQHDTLRDDGRDYAALLREAGVPVRYTEYANMVHAFLSLPRLAPSTYDHAIGEVSNFLLGIT